MPSATERPSPVPLPSGLVVKKGSKHWYLARFLPYRNGEDQVAGVVLTFVDITERKKAEEQLRRSEERFQELADNIDEVFWLAEADWESIIYVSSAFETICGRSGESLCAKAQVWIDAIHQEDRPRVLEARKARKNVGYELEYRIVRPEGARSFVRLSRV